jgi:GTPase SAR1 family protein
MSQIVSKLATGIFGPGQSGKTTLAKHLSKYYADNYSRKSLVLDPNQEVWGPHAKVYSLEDEERFWFDCWRCQRHAIFVEESADTIKRDRELIPVFTRIRHQGHKLHVSGHDAMDLLPVMRRQISTLYLFRQSEESAKVWVNQFTDKRLFKSCSLHQYQFVVCHLFGDVKIKMLSI